MHKTVKQTYSKTRGGYNAALAVPGHGLYAAMVLFLATQIGLVAAMFVVMVPYYYICAKLYKSHNRTDYQQHMAMVRSHKRQEKLQKLRPALNIRVKKPKTSFVLPVAAPKVTLTTH